MNNPVLSALLPVVLLVSIGFIAGRAGWIMAEATRGLSNLVFMVLTPALLFRTMSTVHLEQLNFKPVAMYFVAAILLYAVMFVWQGRDRHAAVRSGIIHPVLLPIMAGLLFAQTGLVLPDVVDRPLQLLGNAIGPLALVLVGATLTQVSVGAQIRGAVTLMARPAAHADVFLDLDHKLRQLLQVAVVHNRAKELWAALQSTCCSSARRAAYAPI